MEEMKCYLPKTLKEALEIKARVDVLPLAGGSDLMVSHKRTMGLTPEFEKPVMIIRNIPELKGIHINEKGECCIGAACLRCHGQSGLSAISALVQPAPMQHSPFSLTCIPFSSGMLRIIITGFSNSGVRPMVLLWDTIRSLPPASGRTSTLAFISRASLRVLGR